MTISSARPLTVPVVGTYSQSHVVVVDIAMICLIIIYALKIERGKADE